MHGALQGNVAPYHCSGRVGWGVKGELRGNEVGDQVETCGMLEGSVFCNVCVCVCVRVFLLSLVSVCVCVFGWRGVVLNVINL